MNKYPSQPNQPRRRMPLSALPCKRPISDDDNSSRSNNNNNKTITVSSSSTSISSCIRQSPAGKPRSDEDSEICLYPSKKCTNRRARKKNGDLHTMCEYHRIRANENQRRLERRRKVAKRRRQPRPTLWNRGFPEPIPIQASLPQIDGGGGNLVEAWKPASPAVLWHETGVWPLIELEILHACLFDDREEPRRSYDNSVDLSQLQLLNGRIIGHAVCPM